MNRIVSFNADSYPKMKCAKASLCSESATPNARSIDCVRVIKTNIVHFVFNRTTEFSTNSTVEFFKFFLTCFIRFRFILYFCCLVLRTLFSTSLTYAAMKCVYQYHIINHQYQLSRHWALQWLTSTQKFYFIFFGI